MLVLTLRLLVLLAWPLMCGAAPASEIKNLSPPEYRGLWIYETDHPDISMLIRLAKNQAAELVRERSGEREESVGSYRSIDGFIVVDFPPNEHGFVRKFVFGGFEVDALRTLVGTMFLYRDGVLLNGVPVMFTQNVEDET